MIITSPNLLMDFTNPSIFLAGGINGCGEWQFPTAEALDHPRVNILNPRRKEPFKEEYGFEQISWEFAHLRYAQAISFWFPKDTLCPITLFELGYWLHSGKELFIGMDPEYKKRFDIETQTMLVRFNRKLCYSLDELIQQIKEEWHVGNFPRN